MEVSRFRWRRARGTIRRVLSRRGWARIIAGWLALLLAAPGSALGQATASGAGSSALKPEELEQIVAPIALYPDSLVAQVLMASTYPLEVVEASRWLRENSKLQDAQRDEALKKQTWDDSVKSLVTFPQVLTMMNEKLDWTQKLGDAFLGQQKDVMAAIQLLRVKAQAEGNLKSTKEQEVKVEQAPVEAAASSAAPAAAPSASAQSTTVVTIQPTNPQVVYVPTYNPTVVYGAWPYPAYPPYAYYPPGYVAATAAISFGVGIAVGAALWGGCNWGRGDVDINVNQYNNFTKNVNTTNLQNRVTARSGGNQGQWQHDPQHRKGVQYRDQTTQQRFGKADQAGVQSREAFRGRAEQGRQELNRGGGDQVRRAGGTSPGSRGQGAHPERGGGNIGSGAGAGGGHKAASAGVGRGGAHGDGGALQGVGNGNQARDASNRGHASVSQARGTGGAHAGGGRGGGGGGRGGGGRRR